MTESEKESLIPYSVPAAVFEKMIKKTPDAIWWTMEQFEANMRKLKDK